MDKFWWGGRGVGRRKIQRQQETEKAWHWSDQWSCCIRFKGVMGQGLKYIKPYMSFTLWEEHGLSMMCLENI
jgi:hypothetical protein